MTRQLLIIPTICELSKSFGGDEQFLMMDFAGKTGMGDFVRLVCERPINSPVGPEGTRGDRKAPGRSRRGIFYGTKSSISMSSPTSVKVSGTSPTMMLSAMATWVETATVFAPVGMTNCTWAVRSSDTRCLV